MSDLDRLRELKELKLTLEIEKLRSESLYENVRAQVAQKELESIESQSEEARIYPFYEQVSGTSVAHAIHELGKWSRRWPGSDITVVFNSPGGGVFDAFALYDYLMELKENGHKVITKSIGMAASMGGILLQAGDERVMGKHAFLLIHEISSGVRGKVSEIADELKFMQQLEEKALDVLSARSSMSKREIRSKWKKTDWWLDAQESLRLGFIDRVAN